MNYILGIDPDLDKSGFALYCKETQQYVDVNCLYLWDLFIRLENLNKTSTLLVFLEAGHLNKNTWHKGGRGASKNVGKGQAIGILLERFMLENKINFKLIEPKGYSNWFKDDKVFKLQTNWQKKVNADARAAAAIVFFNK